MFNFPSAPADGTTFAPVGGPTYVFSSGVWKLAGGGSAFTVVSDTPPASPFPGMLWWESDTGALYFWYVDANSSQWVQINFTPSGGSGSIVVTTLLTSGVYTPPANLKLLEVTCVGGGGGSQSSASTGAGASAGGGGGGGGATAIKLYKASDLAATEPYTVGAGGAISTAGGNTIFKGMTAAGGSGAPTIAAAGTSFAAPGKATGGSASGGDINITGGDGESGMRGAHGMATVSYAGGGSGSFFAGTTVGTYVGATTVSGLAGRFPGGGARGTGNSQNQGTTASGAVGGDGCIILREYF